MKIGDMVVVTRGDYEMSRGVVQAVYKLLGWVRVDLELWGSRLFSASQLQVQEVEQ